jgi:hypothetical protein
MKKTVKSNRGGKIKILETKGEGDYKQVSQVAPNKDE